MFGVTPYARAAPAPAALSGATACYVERRHRRFLADVERLITTDPRPAPANGTRLRARASSIRLTTSGRASVDAPATLIQRVWLDPCNNFAGSGNSLP